MVADRRIRPCELGSVMSAIYLAKSALLPDYRTILQQHTEALSSPLSQHLRSRLES
jgi:hypothetical protein